MKTKRIIQLTLFLSFLCFFYWHCTNRNKAIFDEKDIIDAIHRQGVNEIFMTADSYKYSQNYKKAAEAFEQCLQQNLSVEDKQYAINQLIFSNLMLNEDVIAKSWLDKITQETHPLSKTALADYSYNLGVWAYHTAQPKMAEDYLTKGLGLYRDIYKETHLKFGRCLASSTSMPFVEA
jgi:tetratricopeptide (TPR) repeat protein